MTPTECSRGHTLPTTFLSVILMAQMMKPRLRGVKEFAFRSHGVGVLGSQSFDLSSFFYKFNTFHKTKEKKTAFSPGTSAEPGT